MKTLHYRLSLCSQSKTTSNNYHDDGTESWVRRISRLVESSFLAQLLLWPYNRFASPTLASTQFLNNSLSMLCRSLLNLHYTAHNTLDITLHHLPDESVDDEFWILEYFKLDELWDIYCTIQKKFLNLLRYFLMFIIDFCSFLKILEQRLFVNLFRKENSLEEQRFKPLQLNWPFKYLSQIFNILNSNSDIYLYCISIAPKYSEKIVFE